MVGLIGGAVAALAVMLSGWGGWLALLAYFAAGTLCLLLAAHLAVALRRPAETHAIPA